MSILRMLVTVLALLVASSGPSFAHSVLQSSVPGADTSGSAPDTIKLVFNETVDLAFTTIAITSPDGSVIALDGLTLSEDGRTLTAPVTDQLAAGRYMLDWSLLSIDGHRIEDMFTFTVE